MKRGILAAAIGVFLCAHLILLFQIFRFEGLIEGLSAVRSQMKFPIGWFIAFLDVLFVTSAVMSFLPRVSRLFAFLVEAVALSQIGLAIFVLQFLEMIPGQQPDIRITIDLWLTSFAILFIGSMFPRAAGSILSQDQGFGDQAEDPKDYKLLVRADVGKSPRRILICATERHVCRLLEVIHTREGHQVTTARDTSGAISVLEKIDGNPKSRVDIVIIDEKLPELSGQEILAWFRTRGQASFVRVGVLAKMDWKSKYELTWYEPHGGGW